MSKYLVVVDMQNDFIDGALGSPEAQAIVPKVIDKIKNFKGAVEIRLLGNIGRTETSCGTLY